MESNNPEPKKQSGGALQGAATPQLMEERLQKIETHLAHLEHLFDQLNQIVAEQSDTLRRMQNNQQRLASTIEGLELERIKSTNSKPPHYQ